MNTRAAESERSESRGPRGSDSAAATADRDRPGRTPDADASKRDGLDTDRTEAGRRTGARDTEPGAGDGGRRANSPAVQLQRTQGNRAVKRAATVARDRAEGSDREDRDRSANKGALEPMELPGGLDSGPGAVDQLAALGVHAKLEVGRPDDRYEREADAVAAAVAAGRSAPAVSTMLAGGLGDEATSRQVADDEDDKGLVQARTGDGVGGTPRTSSVAATIRNPGTGRSMPPDVRRRIEPELGASLEGVQVHAGRKAARAAGSLGARAFTHENHIFLGDDESPRDLQLMAHEATHVVQQGAVSGERSSRAAGREAESGERSTDSIEGGAASSARQPTSTGPADVQRFLPDAAFEKLNEWAEYIPGWTLFTVLIGYNPLLRETVDRTPTNLVDGLLKLVPGVGKLIADKLRELGVIEDAFEWVKAKVEEYDLTIERVKRTLSDAWDDLSITGTILGIGEGAIDTLKRHFGGLWEDVKGFASSLVDGVMQFIKDAALDIAESLLAENDAWSLIKKVLGHDPLRDEPVDATPTEILEEFLLLIGKEQHLQQMRERGLVEQTAQWLAARIGQFQELLGTLGDLIDQAWAAIQPENLPNLRENLRSLATDVWAYLQRIWDFASTVAGEVLARIKDALLGRLKEFAENQLPGFRLLTVVLGRNPFTGETVPRTAENLVGGFLSLLPGGEAVYQRLAESGVIAQAGARIEAALGQLGLSWEYVVGLFRSVWETLTIEALAAPVETFLTIVDRFRGPVSRLVNFVGVVLRELFHVLMQAMNFPGDLVGSIIDNVMGAIEAIKQDPIKFLLGMLEAVELGFQSFLDNVLSYLGRGLVDWLFRGLREGGVEPPADLSLGSVLEFVLDVLGITTDRLWKKLADRIGQENVDRIRGAIDRLTGIWTFVRDIQQRGVAAIWEYVESQLGGLWDMVLEKVQEYVVERVINRGIKFLMGMLDPTGVMAVINSFQAFFNAVQSAAEYLTDILAIIEEYTATFAAVARGQLAAGAKKLEEGLANAIPVAIGFLAKQFGLGNIGQKIQEIVAGIRDVVDRAIDWLMDRAESALQSVLGAIGFGEDEDAVDAEDSEKAERIRTGLVAIEEEERRYVTGGRIAREDAVAVANTVKREHPVFDRLEVLEGDNTWDYVYEASPGNTKEGPRKKEQDGTLPYVVGDTVSIDTASGEGMVAVLEQVSSTTVLFKVMTGPMAGRSMSFSREEVINKVGISDHEGHASKHVLVNKLKPEYRKGKRSTFYPSSYRKSVLDWREDRLDELRDDSNPDRYRDEISGEWAPTDDVTIDHIESVGKHWNSGAAGYERGSNTTQADRRDFYNEISNMQLATQESNRKKGGETMQDEVGPKFRGPED